MSTESTPGGMQGMLPGAAAAGGLRQDDDENATTSDGAAVGQADREADVERSGAGGGDDAVGDAGGALMSDDLGMENRGSGDNVPVGAGDAEADRERTTDAG
jgi:hypothetical protein